MLNVRGNPAINAMANNVVKLTIFGDIVFTKVGLTDFKILQAKSFNLLFTFDHLNFGIIEAQKLALWIAKRQGNQVPARSGAQFKHPAVGCLGRVHSKKAANER